MAFRVMLFLHSVGVSPLNQRSRIICFFFLVRRFYSLVHTMSTASGFIVDGRG
jgi:hypothetical protein